MTSQLVRGQRVEVARSLAGVTTYDLGTVADFPNEDTHVRVKLDVHVDAGHPARVFDRGDVSTIPEAVSRHITRLLSALGSVSNDELDAVAGELHRRLMTHASLIDFARDVADRSQSVAAAVRGLS